MRNPESGRVWRMLLQQERQRLLTAFLHGPGPAQIDSRDRYASTRRHLGEAKAGIDHQRGTDDEHSVGVFECRLCGRDLIARNVFSIEHNIGLEDAAAGRTRWYGKRREIHLAEVGITVWQRRGIQLGPISVKVD
jgi:hypothetical protein